MLDNLRRDMIGGGGHYLSNIWLNVARHIGSVITKGHTTILFCPITMIDALLTGINESYKPLYLCWVIPLHGGNAVEKLHAF